ncbi:ATP-binding protein [Terrabacter carboxydivorans]|uniref:ATP-binding protein n=1 Tax=Terrabacter carboxydivorans TaxID=619730 RepID=UPI003CD068C4
MTGEFLGAGHHELLDALTSRLARIRAGDPDVARVVVLRGPSGIGKTRVLRELYGRLRASQRSPGYWPPLPEDTLGGHGAGADPMPNRKRLSPSPYRFEWPPDSLPDFAWWSFDCQRMADGSLVDVLAQARPFIRTHLLPVTLAWRQAAGWPAAVRSQSEVLRHVGNARIWGRSDVRNRGHWFVVSSLPCLGF